MGHDITAFHPRNGEAVAYNRRGATNPLNQVLYLALGVMDEAYAGCSGNHSEVYITREQFQAALEVLENKSYAGMTRERNVADDIADMFRAMGATFVPSAPVDPDVSRECEFVEKCIACLESEGLPGLTVQFG